MCGWLLLLYLRFGHDGSEPPGVYAEGLLWLVPLAAASGVTGVYLLGAVATMSRQPVSGRSLLLLALGISYLTAQAGIFLAPPTG